MIKRYAVVVDWRDREKGTELIATNLPRKRAVVLAKQIAGRDVECLRGWRDPFTGRYERPRSGRTIYRGHDARAMVEALAEFEP